MWEKSDAERAFEQISSAYDQVIGARKVIEQWENAGEIVGAARGAEAHLERAFQLLRAESIRWRVYAESDY